MRVVVVLTDDQRWDDLYFMPELQARLVAKGIKYRNHRADLASCVPARAEFFTGRHNTWHNQVQGTEDTFAKYAVEGRGLASQSVWDGTTTQTQRVWYGPHEFEWPFNRDTATDDPQRDSGSLPNWLHAAGVTTALIGKYTNHYGRDVGSLTHQVPTGNGTVGAGESFDYGTPDASGIPIGARRIPPDWDYWYCHVGYSNDGNPTPNDNAPPNTRWDGGVTNNWYHWTVEKTIGSTPTNMGTTPMHAANWVTRTPTWESYSKPISSIACSGSTATIITSVPLHGLAVGDEIIIEGVTHDGRYNTTPASTNVPGVPAIVTGLLNEFLFTYTLQGGASGLGPAGGSGQPAATGTVYHEKGYLTNRIAEQAVQFINGRGKSEPWFMYLATSSSHQESIPADTDTYEPSRKYAGVTPITSAFMWGGTPGAKSPAATTPPNGNAKLTQWAQRQDMLRSLDDLIAKVDDACKAKGWEPVFLFTSDQGVMYGEHDYWTGSIAGGDSTDFPKWMAWEPCIKAPLIIRHPRWEKGITHDEHTMQADLPLTILDWFGLTTHPAHAKREGTSLARLRRMGGSTTLAAVQTGVANRNRGHFLVHQPQDGSSTPIQRSCYLTSDGFKFIETSTGAYPFTRAIYNLNVDPEEQTNLLIANPSGTFSRYGWDVNTFAFIAFAASISRGAIYRALTL